MTTQTDELLDNAIESMDFAIEGLRNSSRMVSAVEMIVLIDVIRMLCDARHKADELKSARKYDHE